MLVSRSADALKCCLTTMLLCALLIISGCSGKKPGPVTPSMPYQQGEIRDLRNIPQDLTFFTRDNPDREILDSDTQRIMYANYRKTFFSSWHQSRPSVKVGEVSQMLSGRARGWKDGSNTWTQAEWNGMKANAGLGTYPNTCAPGITIRATDLRELPTHEARYSKPTPNVRSNPFDNFQYSLLPVGTPVMLCHQSSDGRWYYVETPLASGWVDASDLARVSSGFMETWEQSPLACIMREKVNLGHGRTADIGTVLPMDGSTSLLIPLRDETGFATAGTAEIQPGDAERMPVRMTPATVAALANQMVGQRYGWGGMLGLRDCSATTRDLMSPFGLWLPRNSRAQGRRGNTMSLAGMTPSEKEAFILRNGVPFASLVVMKGHVVLYVGEWKDRACIFHNMWGIRVIGAPNNRLVIGRAVVTSLTPGAELPNLANGTTLADHFHTLTVLGGAHK